MSTSGPLRRIQFLFTSERKERSSNDTVFISDHDYQRICGVFVSYGCPPLQVSDSDSDKFVLPENGEPLGRQKFPEILGSIMGIEPDCFSSSDNCSIFAWEELKQRCSTTLSADELKYLYDEIWMPFCCLLVCPLSPISLAYHNKIQLPNPFLKASDHHSISRGLILVFLSRQHILYAIRYVLWNLLPELLTLLRSPVARTAIAPPHYETLFPVWWCPWIHDVAIMVGFLKHGYMALEKILLDNSLPFCQNRLKNHIRRAFFTGARGQASAASLVFSSHEDAEHWLDIVSFTFPDVKDIENR